MTRPVERSSRGHRNWLRFAAVPVIDLLRAKKILVTHGTGFNWPDPDHFRLVTLPTVEDLQDAIGRISSFLETLRNA